MLVKGRLVIELQAAYKTRQWVSRTDPLLGVKVRLRDDETDRSVILVKMQS